MVARLADIQRVADEFMRDVVARESRAAGAIAQANANIARRIARETEALARAAARVKFASERDAAKWLQNEARYHALRESARVSYDKFARFAAGEIVGAQRELVAAAQEHTHALTAMQLPDSAAGLGGQLRVVPVEAVSQLVGQLQPGSPLWALKGIGEDAMNKVGEHLVSGLARGQSPRATARAIAPYLNGSTARALTISRTETMRAYRESARAQMMINTDVVAGWRWNAQLTTHTCASCWAMHGQMFDSEITMGTHPNCRCSLIPVTRTFADMGLDPSLDQLGGGVDWGPTGEDAFAALDASDQRAILGPSKYDAYASGQITLGDTVATRTSPEWGTTRSVASLPQALSTAGR